MADAQLTIDRWVDEWETDDYPSGRRRVRARWYVKDVRGGRKTVARQTETGGGRWSKPKVLTSGTHAKIGVSEEEDRAYLFIFDVHSGSLTVYSGNMQSRYYEHVPVSAGHVVAESEDSWGFVKAVVLSGPPAPAKKPPRKEKMSGPAEFLGRKREDRERKKVKGHRFGEWGVYKDIGVWRTDYNLIHIPTGKLIKSEDSRKWLLFKAKRLNEFVPELGEEINREAARCIREIVLQWMPPKNLRNNGEPKPGAEVPPPPQNRVTNRDQEDGNRAAVIQNWLVKLRHLQGTDNEKHKALLGSLLRANKILSTGMDANDPTLVATRTQMQAIRRMVDDPTHVWHVLAKKLIAERLPDGMNRGDFVSIRLRHATQRAVALKSEGDLRLVAFEQFGTPTMFTVERERVIAGGSLRTPPADFVREMLAAFPLDNTPKKLVRGVDTYKTLILAYLADCGDKGTPVPDKPGLDLPVGDAAMLALDELQDEGKVELVESSYRNLYRITDTGMGAFVPDQILAWMKRVIPMLPLQRSGLLTLTEVTRKFDKISELDVRMYLSQLETAGKITRHNDSFGLPGAKRDPLPETPLEKHLHKEDGNVYADTWALNHVREFWSEASVEHMGMGEFYVKTPLGRVDFDRMRGKDFPGQSGRSHRLYGDEKAVTEFVRRLEEFTSTPGHATMPDGFGFEEEEPDKGTGKLAVPMPPEGKTLTEWLGLDNVRVMLMPAQSLFGLWGQSQQKQGFAEGSSIRVIRGRNYGRQGKIVSTSTGGYLTVEFFDAVPGKPDSDQVHRDEVRKLTGGRFIYLKGQRGHRDVTWKVEVLEEDGQGNEKVVRRKGVTYDVDSDGSLVSRGNAKHNPRRVLMHTYEVPDPDASE